MRRSLAFAPARARPARGVLRAARADDFNLPGLSSDSQAYVERADARHPGRRRRRSARRTAEQQAAAAAQKKDYAAVVTALEERLALGEATGAAMARPRHTRSCARRRPTRSARSPPRGRASGSAESGDSGNPAAAADGRRAARAGPCATGGPGARAGASSARRTTPDYKRMLADAAARRRAVVRRVRAGGRGRSAARLHRVLRAARPAATTSTRRTGCGSIRRCRAPR